MALLISAMTSVLVIMIFTVVASIRNRRARDRQLKVLSEYSSQSNEKASTRTLSKIANFLVRQILDSGYGTRFNAACIRAGIWQESDIQKAVEKKIYLLGAASLLTIAIAELGGVRNPIIVLIPVIAFFIPDALIRSKGIERGEAIARALPETIDLINMTVGAGLGFQAGLDRISRSETNPLSAEFRRVLSEIRLGDSRTHAFRSMAERINRPEMWNFTNSIIQVDKLGIPITEALKELAKSMRSERREKARERAQKLPVKILAPIMIFLLPAVLVIVLAPAVVSIMGMF